MGVLSDGQKYGIPAGIVYSMPLSIDAAHNWKVIEVGCQLFNWVSGEVVQK